MALLDPLPSTALIPGIAEPHQSTAAAIQGAVGLGLFSAAEAELAIGRIRALASRDAADALLLSPNETVTGTVTSTFSPE